MSIRSSILLFCVALVFLAIGCRAMPTAQPGSTLPADAPTYEELGSAHNARVNVLQQIHASGVIEIKRRGRLLADQADMEFWLRQPRDTALRVAKLGEVLMWVGSDADRYWVFDRTGDERVLHIGRHDREVITEDTGVAVRPLALLDLMGITPINGGAGTPALRAGTLGSESRGTHSVTLSEAHNAWVIDAQGRGGPMRMYFDRQSRLPVRIEAMNDAGEVAAHSTLRRYESVPQPGMSVAAFPRLPYWIDIAGLAEGTVTGEIAIRLGQATSMFDESILDRVFDLERLRQTLRPDRVEG